MSMTKRIYISGPITGLPGGNSSAFRVAQARLRLAHPNTEVVVPLDNGLPEDSPWAEHMRADIKILMDCDAVAMLPGWRKSSGACIERNLALTLMLDVRPLGDWLRIKADA